MKSEAKFIAFSFLQDRTLFWPRESESGGRKTRTGGQYYIEYSRASVVKGWGWQQRRQA